MTSALSLVVGVDEFSDTALAPLPGARVDALRMAQVLGPTSRLVLNDAVSQASRLAILCAIREWLSDLEDSVTGLFYFAGHGVRGDAGLVLCGRDYEAHCCLESGIPVDTIWEVVRNSQTRASRLVFILDVCRTGDGSGALGALPPQVICVTTAADSNAAYEVAGHGQFVRAFELALGEVPVVPARTGTGVTLSMVLDRTRELLAASNFPQELEVAGASHHSLVMDIARSRQYAFSPHLRICLVSRGLKSGAKHLADRINSSLYRLLGVEGMHSQLAELPGADVLRVLLPGGGTLFDARVLIQAILVEFHGVFRELRIEGASGFGVVEAKKVVRELKAIILPHDDENTELRASWRARFCDAHIHFSFSTISTGISIVAASTEIATPTVDLIGDQLSLVVSYVVSRQRLNSTEKELSDD